MRRGGPTGEIGERRPRARVESTRSAGGRSWLTTRISRAGGQQQRVILVARKGGLKEW